MAVYADHKSGYVGVCCVCVGFVMICGPSLCIVYVRFMIIYANLYIYVLVYLLLHVLIFVDLYLLISLYLCVCAHVHVHANLCICTTL